MKDSKISAEIQQDEPVLVPGNDGQNCPGNPELCDECDYLMCCTNCDGRCDQCFEENRICVLTQSP